jgi:hypothetical protein
MLEPVEDKLNLHLASSELQTLILLPHNSKDFRVLLLKSHLTKTTVGIFKNCDPGGQKFKSIAKCKKLLNL